jgi:simple sugar transport system permease protein
VVAVAAGMVALSAVRAITNTPDLTSSGTFGAALRLSVPIALAGLGGLWAERAGVVNIGLEGMLILGTWFGAYAGSQWGPWQGVAFGILGGALGGLVHAIATVTFGVDHVVSGVAINLLGGGVARYLSVIAYKDGTRGGGATQSPKVRAGMGKVDAPFLSGGRLLGWRSPDVLGWFERKHWFLLSDVSGMVRGVTVNVSLVVVLAVALFPLTWWILWRTPFGLRLRSVGEDPAAAESLGVNVYRMKYAAVTISGGLAGLGGAALVLVFAGIYREGQTAGRGFIGLAAMIFGNWRPGGLAAGAGLFGFTDALQLRDETAVRSVLLFVAIILAVLALRSFLQRKVVGGAVTLAVAAGLVGFFLTGNDVPRQFFSFFPHLTTLLVLAFAAQRLRPPAADGIPYRKGQSR